MLAGLWGRRWSLVIVRVALVGWLLSGDASLMLPFSSAPLAWLCCGSRSWPVKVWGKADFIQEFKKLSTVLNFPRMVRCWKWQFAWKPFTGLYAQLFSSASSERKNQLLEILHWTSPSIFKRKTNKNKGLYNNITIYIAFSLKDLKSSSIILSQNWMRVQEVPR